MVWCGSGGLARPCSRRARQQPSWSTSTLPASRVTPKNNFPNLAQNPQLFQKREFLRPKRFDLVPSSRLGPLSAARTARSAPPARTDRAPPPPTPTTATRPPAHARPVRPHGLSHPQDSRQPLGHACRPRRRSERPKRPPTGPPAASAPPGRPPQTRSPLMTGTLPELPPPPQRQRADRSSSSRTTRRASRRP